MSSKAKKFEGKNDDEQKKNIIEFLENLFTTYYLRAALTAEG